MKTDTLSKILRREHRELCYLRGCAGCANRGEKIDSNRAYLCRIGEIPNSDGFCEEWEEDLKVYGI